MGHSEIQVQTLLTFPDSHWLYLTQRLYLTRLSYTWLHLTLNLGISECPKVLQNPLNKDHFPKWYSKGNYSMGNLAVAVEILNTVIHTCSIHQNVCKTLHLITYFCNLWHFCFSSKFTIKSDHFYLSTVTFHFPFLDIAFLIGSLYFINFHK